MTGFSAIPLAEQGGDAPDAHLAGISKILGPRWAQLPAITIGLLGVQVFWSVEMSYGMYVLPTAPHFTPPNPFLPKALPISCPSALQRLPSPWSSWLAQYQASSSSPS